jgi:branched-chain amino acid transport system permease protein
MGPVVGVAFLALLPEISRPFAEYRPMIMGIIMILIMNYLPHGLVDTAMYWFKRHSAERRSRTTGEGHVRATA